MRWTEVGRSATGERRFTPPVDSPSRALLPPAEGEGLIATLRGAPTGCERVPNLPRLALSSRGRRPAGRENSGLGLAGTTDSTPSPFAPPFWGGTYWIENHV